MIHKKHIDLEKIIAGKNPALLKMLPAPMLRYIKRVIHQDDLNDFLSRAEHKHDHDFVKMVIEDFKIHLTSKGLENIPKQGGCIVACNHPLGGMDGIAVMHEIGKVRKDIKAMVNDILMNLVNLRPLLIATNKHGRNAVESVKIIDQIFASEECTIVFPAGLVSRKQSGKIKDLEWKKSFITKAKQYKRNIIPVYVEARNSHFFYNLALFRKKLGIKANIEMFFLVDEMYKLKGKPFHVTFGEPVPYITFTKEHSDHYWAEKFKDHVYALKDGKKIL